MDTIQIPVALDLAVDYKVSFSIADHLTSPVQPEDISEYQIEQVTSLPGALVCHPDAHTMQYTHSGHRYGIDQVYTIAVTGVTELHGPVPFEVVLSLTVAPNISDPVDINGSCTATCTIPAGTPDTSSVVTSDVVLDFGEIACLATPDTVYTATATSTRTSAAATVALKTDDTGAWAALEVLSVTSTEAVVDELEALIALPSGEVVVIKVAANVEKETAPSRTPDIIVRTQVTHSTHVESSVNSGHIVLPESESFVPSNVRIDPKGITVGEFEVLPDGAWTYTLDNINWVDLRFTEDGDIAAVQKTPYTYTFADGSTSTGNIVIDIAPPAVDFVPEVLCQSSRMSLPFRMPVNPTLVDVTDKTWTKALLSDGTVTSTPSSDIAASPDKTLFVVGTFSISEAGFVVLMQTSPATNLDMYGNTVTMPSVIISPDNMTHVELTLHFVSTSPIAAPIDTAIFWHTGPVFVTGDIMEHAQFGLEGPHPSAPITYAFTPTPDSAAPHGKLHVASNGVFRYTPHAVDDIVFGDATELRDTFTYTLCDAWENTVSESITVVIPKPATEELPKKPTPDEAAQVIATLIREERICGTALEWGVYKPTSNTVRASVWLAVPDLDTLVINYPVQPGDPEVCAKCGVSLYLHGQRISNGELVCPGDVLYYNIGDTSAVYQAPYRVFTRMFVYTQQTLDDGHVTR